MSEQRIDKSKWGVGPWQDEPDRLEWRHAGLPCLIVRGQLGALCGYVGVPPGHRYHGVGHDDVEGVGAHGGLTYAEGCRGEICHVPAPGEPDDVWWLGFDCAHAFDYVPGLHAQLREICEREHNPLVDVTDARAGPMFGEVYRDLAYVKAEVEDLAEQLACPAS
jgi:hypothetical protein